MFSYLFAYFFCLSYNKIKILEVFMKKITVDGNTAVALSAYACNELAVIYPITPSSPMAEVCDSWSGEKKLNCFGQPLKIVEMQSEGGASGAVHGSLACGVLTTTFTASQGLLLMIPNMYKIAGELLPCVFHVSARALATHALSIFGDHSDVMACRQTGFLMIASNNVQEAHDMATISMMATLNSRIPVLHFFDGFRTSHEISKIDALETEEIKKLLPEKKIVEFRSRGLNPKHPHQQGTAQNPDVFFQNREACNIFYDNAYDIILEAMQKFEKQTKRHYAPFEYVGPSDAEKVIVMMGSGADTMEQEVLKQKNVGLVKVRVYRPFNSKAFAKILPKTTKVITVLDRTKESGSVFEPLCTDVMASLLEQNKTNLKVLGGRYGLGSKDFTPSMAKAVILNCTTKGKNHFTVGIDDDVTNTSLKVKETFDVYDGNECLFYGLGSDGTVSANKNSIKIIGNNTKLYAQGYFVYDSKKSGSVTISHLRFGKEPIKAHYEIEKANFVACHNQRFVAKYDILSHLRQNGTFLLNTNWSIEELEEKLPAEFKKEIAKKNAKFFVIDAQKLANDLGLRGKISTIMQSAFFFLTNIVDFSLAKTQMKKMAEKSYGKAGPKVVESNFKAIDESPKHLKQVKIPASWKNEASVLASTKLVTANEFYDEIMKVIEKQNGNLIKVSKFSADGRIPTDTTKFEKRGIAERIPCWKKENCIQCNFCSFVCPHGAIKPVLIDKKTKKPKTFESIKALQTDKYEFRIQISPLDCTGCGSCVNVCPAREKALVLSEPEKEILEQKQNFEFAEKLENNLEVYGTSTAKGSQFAHCHFQFSGACAGCGETPYIKLASQLFGSNMVIANATGCSSIYGGSFPSCPYTKNKNGMGPAWANSLFEDNAEFGFGMRLSQNVQTQRLIDLMKIAIKQKSKCSSLFKKWLATLEDFSENNKVVVKIFEALKTEIKETENKELLKTLKQIELLKDFLTQKSVWIIGGDGWAYDIGYGGLDHVLASNEDVNILVLDTQVYSNTGGQSSKATPCGASAKFAETGKTTSKKSLALMALNYPNVYVAQVAMGANMQQTLNALREAQAHKGPSIVIAYSTCINQGIDMSKGMEEMKKAVQSGYWHLFRYSPENDKLTLDSPMPTADYLDFVSSERRYASLLQKQPQHAKELILKAKQDSDKLLETLVLLSKKNEKTE